MNINININENQYIKHTLFVFTVFILSATATSQTHKSDTTLSWKSGIGANIGFNSHRVAFTGLPNVPSCCPMYNKGSGYGIDIGAFFALPLTNTLMLSLGAEYLQHDGLISSTQKTIIDNNGLSEANIEYSIQTQIRSLAIVPECRYELGPIVLHGGLLVGMLISPQYSQKEKIISPSTVLYANDRRDRLTYSGTIDQTSALESAVRFGLSTSLPLSSDRKWSIEPRLSVSTMLTNVLRTGETWKVHSLQLGASLVYTARTISTVVLPQEPERTLERKPETKPKQDSIAKPYVISRYVPLLLDSNNKNVGNKLIIRNTVSQNTYAMINYIFFDSASAQIPSRYKLLSQTESGDFSTDNLNATSTMQIYYNILNLVGKRMQNESKTRIILVGCNSADGAERNNTNLSKARAESVKQYLCKVWSIDPARISISARNLPESPSNSVTTDGNEENRRVEILTEASELLEPLIFNDTLCTLNAASISYPATTQSNVKPRAWSLDITVANKILKSFSGVGTPPADIVWNMNKDRVLFQRLHGEVNAKLKITNSDGQILETDAEALQVTQQRIRNSTIQRFSLITFAFNASTISKGDQHIIEIIRKHISSKSMVQIAGYTDRLGDAVHNQQLSEQRALQVAKMLDVAAESAHGEGAQNLLYDNSTPEGRFYSRTVIVTIETPLD